MFELVQNFLLTVKIVRVLIYQTTELQLSNGTKTKNRLFNSWFGLIRPDYKVDSSAFKIYIFNPLCMPDIVITRILLYTC